MTFPLFFLSFILFHFSALHKKKASTSAGGKRIKGRPFARLIASVRRKECVLPFLLIFFGERLIKKKMAKEALGGTQETV